MQPMNSNSPYSYQPFLQTSGVPFLPHHLPHSAHKINHICLHKHIYAACTPSTPPLGAYKLTKLVRTDTFAISIYHNSSIHRLAPHHLPTCCIPINQIRPNKHICAILVCHNSSVHLPALSQQPRPHTTTNTRRIPEPIHIKFKQKKKKTINEFYLYSLRKIH